MITISMDEGVLKIIGNKCKYIYTLKGVHLLIMSTINGFLILNSNLMTKH
jgi:hypothetical protein